MKNAIGMAAIMGVLALSTAAFAGNDGYLTDYGTQPGYTKASDCGTFHGSFGAFGKGANLGIVNPPGNPDQPGHALNGSYPGPGTDGQQTGINNSAPCGQRALP